MAIRQGSSLIKLGAELFLSLPELRKNGDYRRLLRGPHVCPNLESQSADYEQNYEYENKLFHILAKPESTPLPENLHRKNFSVTFRIDLRFGGAPSAFDGTR
ncbi:MAG: hypothetical protein WCA95_12795 [Opitutaceae bacterium]